ncbi:MAG: type II toxin-antitoxin system RelE/ParE family toxin [Chloroflexi bacterium]|nr:type II toxin-antitoxin system RelE/ParE family toxin [Chloroflexota bacterium]
MFEVVLSRDAARSLDRQALQTRRRILAAIEKLAAYPQKGKKLHGELEGLYTLRVGGMRVVYEVDSGSKAVVVHAVGPRGDVYKN